MAALYGDASLAVTQPQAVLFGAALLALLCTVVWTALVTGAFLWLLRGAGWLRVKERDEVRGLDALIDDRAEAVRNAMYVMHTMPTNKLEVAQRECARCSLWIAGDCVPCGTGNYHIEVSGVFFSLWLFVYLFVYLF